MGDLKLDALAADHGPIFAPVELESLARLENQGHKCPPPGCLHRVLPISLPRPYKCSDPLIRSVKAKLHQICMHLLGGAPVFARFALLCNQPARQFLRKRIQLARPRRRPETGLNDISPQIFPDGVARQTSPP